MKSYDGDIESYRQDLLSDRGAKDRARRGMADANGGMGENRNIRAAARKAAADKRAGLAPLKKAMQVAEKSVERLTVEVAKLDALLASPELYADAAKAQRISMERGQAAKRLAEVEEAWLAATAAFEDAEAQDLDASVR